MLQANVSSLLHHFGFIFSLFRSVRESSDHYAQLSRAVQMQYIQTHNVHIPKNRPHLVDWIWRNLRHPYPTERMKETLARQEEISKREVREWFERYRRHLRYKGVLPQATRRKRCDDRQREPGRQEAVESPSGDIESDVDDRTSSENSCAVEIPEPAQNWANGVGKISRYTAPNFDHRQSATSRTMATQLVDSTTQRVVPNESGCVVLPFHAPTHHPASTRASLHQVTNATAPKPTIR